MGFLGAGLSGGYRNADGDVVPDGDRSTDEGSHEGADEGDTFTDAESANEDADAGTDGNMYCGSTDKYPEAIGNSGADGYITAANGNLCATYEYTMSDVDTGTDTDEHASADQYFGANGNKYRGATDRYSGADADAVLCDTSHTGTDTDTVSNKCANPDGFNSVGLGGVWRVTSFSLLPKRVTP